jgi:chitinase
MKATLYTILIFSILFISCKPKSIEVEKDTKNIMAYYVPSDMSVEQLPLDKLTHIIFSFTEVVDNKMIIKNPNNEPKLKDLADAKKNHPHLKVMVACGGWTGSKGFSNMALTAENRKVFVKSVIDFLKNYNLDGLDIDWEYPALPGDNNIYRDKDTHNFTLLMKELKEGMLSVNKNWQLTFAAAGWEKYFDHIELSEVMKYADYINLMTYDFVGESTPYTAHHTNLGFIDPEVVKDTPAKEYADSLAVELNLRSTENIVEYCISKGVASNKIVIGGAFYGKVWKGVNSNNNGLYEFNNGFQGYATYKEIKNNYFNKNGFIYYWDSVAKAPYLFNKQDSLFLSYDDEKSISLKSGYVKDKGLGGIMFWQLSQDTDNFELINSIYNTLKE